MAVTKCLVAFLEIFLLIEAALAARACDWAQFGHRTDYDIQLGESVLEAGFSSFRVDIPDVCNGNTAGVRVTACDYDEAPQLLVTSSTLAYVSRQGSLSLNGYITAKVYCYDDRFLGSSSTGGKDTSLSVHAVTDSRRGLREYSRVLRSADGTHTLAYLDNLRTQPTLDALRHTETRQEETARQTLTTNARQQNDARLQKENESLRSNQATNIQQSSQAIRNALDAHIRQAALAQARHQASQRSRLNEHSFDTRQKTAYRHIRHTLQSSDSSQASDGVRDATADKAHQANIDQALKLTNQKTTNAEKTSTGHRQAEQTRLRRDIQSSNNRQEAEERNDVIEDTGSRSGLRLLISQEIETRQASDAVREILAANARQASLAQASLRTLEEARRAAQMADARQASDIVRQALEDNARQAAIAQGSLQALREAASRAAQSIDVHQSEKITRENTVPDERDALTEHVLLAQDTNRNAQSDPSRRVQNAIHEALADNARQAALNHIHREALIQAQRRAQTAPAVGTRQAADVVRKVIAINAREAAIGQARLQTINDAIQSSHTSQRSDDRQSNDAVRETSANNARQAAINQALQQAALGGRFTGARQEKSYRRLRRSEQTSNSNKVADAVRGAKADKIRQANSFKSKARLAEQTANAQRQDDKNRSRRSLQHFDNNRQASEFNEYALSTNSRQQPSYQRQDTLSHDSLHQDILHQARLQALQKESRTSQNLYSREYLTANARQNALNQSRSEAQSRQSSDNARESETAIARQEVFDRDHRQVLHRSLENTYRGTSKSNERQGVENIHLQGIQDTGRSAFSTDYYQDSNLLHNSFGNYAKQGVLDNARLQAIEEASRIAQEANARQLAAVLRESLENTKARQIAIEQARRQANEILKSVQGIDARHAEDAIREALAENARQTSFDQARLQNLQVTGRVGQAINSLQANDLTRESTAVKARQDALEQARREALGEGRWNAQGTDARQANTVVREALETNERQAILNQARFQVLQKASRTAQALNSRESANARQIALDQARRVSSSEGRQNAQSVDGRQAEELVREALAEKARQSTVKQARRQSLNQRRDGVQITDGRQVEEAQQQAAYQARLAEEISRRNSQFQAMNSPYF